MIGGGVVLWLVERIKPYGDDASRVTSLDRVSVRQALTIGVIQLAALVPGTSRSASSIVGGLLVGLDRPTATAFSFYLAIPTLGGATLYSLVKNLDTLQASGGLVALAIGTLAAFITAAIRDPLDAGLRGTPRLPRLRCLSDRRGAPHPARLAAVTGAAVEVKQGHRRPR